MLTLIVLLLFLASFIPSPTNAPQTEKPQVAAQQVRTEPTLSLRTIVPAPPTLEAWEWERVWNWSGSGNLSPRLFTITGDQWRIRWTTDRHGGRAGSVFVLTVYRTGRDTPLQQASARQAPHDEGILGPRRDGPGDYRLNVTSRDLDWTVVVEEYVRSTAGT